MDVTLSQILNLVGKLDDAAGNETPRERFRQFLMTNVTELGQLRDYVTECLNTHDLQHARALQDLVNYLGRFLGFEVVFGRYQGVQNQIGFDGHWVSPTKFHVVVETKTSETFAIETSALLGYVDKLIDKNDIPNWDKALGLFVVGKLNPKVSQLENSIVATGRTQQLRIISVESLLRLAELANEYDLGHQDILALVRPASPTIDPVVSLMGSLVVGKPEVDPPSDDPPPKPQPEPDGGQPHGDEIAYWITPVKSDEVQTAEECIQALVGQENIYTFSEKAPGRQHIKPGDWIGFYATTKGVVAHAKVVSPAKHEPHPAVRHSETYPWVFTTDDAKLYLDDPVVVDASLRAELDAFSDKDPNKPWSWFVFTTRNLTKHDFDLLTRSTGDG
jgi:hypothetical protein